MFTFAGIGGFSCKPSVQNSNMCHVKRVGGAFGGKVLNHHSVEIAAVAANKQVDLTKSKE